jgi:hypothetical protein
MIAALGSWEQDKFADPEVLSLEIVENHESALQQYGGICEELGEKPLAFEPISRSGLIFRLPVERQRRSTRSLREKTALTKAIS